MKPYLSFPKPDDRRGVALVVTLIMLAIVTVFSVAFLSVARRERTSVAVKGELDDARLMSEMAQARAQAEILGRIAASSNLHNFGMLVSVNVDGQLATNEASFPVALVAALSNDARVPVFIDRGGGITEFPFYLDLNRNRTNEPPVVTPPDPTNGVRYLVTPGDADWIGVPEIPGQVHSRSNRYIGRYAYILVPSSGAGRALDVNFMHNNAKGSALGFGFPPPAQDDGFVRNHGFANWELDLGAFLYQLNSAPAAWGGVFAYNPFGVNQGVAYVAANDILRFRYATNNLPQFNFNTLYPDIIVPAFSPLPIQRPLLFRNDSLDGYSDGPVGGLPLAYDITFPGVNDDTSRQWPGAPQSNRLDTLEAAVDASLRDRFPRFHDRLTNVMSAFNVDIADRNTFYRLLEQLGTDSVPGPPVRLAATNNVFPNFLLSGVTLVTNLAGHGFNPDEWIRVGADDPGNVIGTFRVADTWDDAFTLDVAGLGTAGAAFTLQRNNRIHLNYNNLSFHETNFVPWTPIGFFSATADRLLRMSTNYGMLFGATNISLTNIPIAPTNHYTPRVHQMLQIAANLYDATTTNFFPSVFRPHFLKTGGGNVSVSGYAEVIGSTITNSALNPRIALPLFATNDAFYTAPGLYTNLVMFGVPPVIGAKKFLPTFNEFSMNTRIQVARKLQIERSSPSVLPTATNQLFFLGISNTYGAEVWNSYNRFYPNPLNGLFELATVSSLSNTLGFLQQTAFGTITNVNMNAVSNRSPYSFTAILPPLTNNILPLSAYRQAAPYVPNSFEFVTNRTLLMRNSSMLPVYEKNLPLTAPDWFLSITNRVFFALVDSTTSNIVDIVATDGFSWTTNLTDVMTAGQPNNNSTGLRIQDFWRTQLINGVAVGISNQIAYSLDPSLGSQNLWSDTSLFGTTLTNVASASAVFRAAYLNPTVSLVLTNNQAPFAPAMTMDVKQRWQVDDPFVRHMAEHYFAVDASGENFPEPNPQGFWTNDVVRLETIGVQNARFRPWGGNRDLDPFIGPQRVDENTITADVHAFDPIFKDPMIRWPDEWDFPTNKFGNAGWIGRVHRGTPWQTIYLKSAAPTPRDWLRRVNSIDTYPTNDWALADLFTVHVDDNARRGQLSVNQHNPAAWAAALAGMPVLRPATNGFDASVGATGAGSVVPPPIEAYIAPDGQYGVTGSGFINEFSLIVGGIERARAAQGGTPVVVGGAYVNGLYTNGAFATRTFNSVGAILAAPELSIGVATNSPFIGPVDPINLNPTPWRKMAVNDAMAERIPQQLLSLLTIEGRDLAARFTVYGWGQSLAPADRSLVTVPGPNFQICTNYQVTGESVSKTVFRLEPRVINTVPGGLTNPVVNLRAVIESFEYLQNP